MEAASNKKGTDNESSEKVISLDIDTKRVSSSIAINSQESPKFTVEEVIDEYFDHFDEKLHSFSRYESAQKAIDFLRLRRFLMTTYNTLVE
ncbi:MAG: hypothetical protein M0P91_08960, partial [Sulfuricurvum sp.]|nr:hypothetical protein [Sulfuricurvum sp.]